MNRKVLLKAVSAAAAAAQILSCTAFAAVITGGGEGTESGFYMYESFNDLTDENIGSCIMKKSTSGATLTRYEVGTDNQAVQITTSAASKMGYVTLGKLDFSKGPLLLSYDVISPSGATITYGSLNYGTSGTNLIFLPRFDNSYVIKGYSQKTPSDPYAEVGAVDNASYPNGLTCTTSTKKYTAGSAYTVQVLLDYDSESQILTVKEYINGEPLLNSSGEQYIYKMKRADMETAMGSSITLRFNVGNGKTAVIDNISLRTEGQLSLPNGTWLNSADNGIALGYSVTYDEAFSYSKAVNKITASDYTMTQYDMTTDPLLLSGGTAVADTYSWRTANMIGIKNVTNDANKPYVFELTNPEAIKNFNGDNIVGKYTLLHCSSSPTILRKARIYDAEGVQLSLDNGKLPQEAASIVFDVAPANSDELETAGWITCGDKAAVRSGDEFTLNLGTLEPATDYTITVPAVANYKGGSQTLTTTGEKPKINAAIERFTDSSAVDGMYRSEKTNLTLAYDSEGERMQYTNMSESTASTQYAKYTFPQAFDFTKGAMYVSFDVELNQTIKYITPTEPNTYPSYLFNPQLYLEGTLIGYMPVLEQYGLRCRTESGGRTVVPKELSTMSKGDTCTIGILCSYDADAQTMTWTQLLNGQRILDQNGVVIPPYSISNITSEMLEGAPNIRFYSRYLQEGGVYVDNIAVTTIDGITADSILTMAGSTATINIKSTVQFPEGTDADLSAPHYANDLTKSDIKVTKYTDTLLARGTAVDEFGFDAQTMTVSGLESGGIYGIEIKDTSKLTSISGSPIDTKYFKVGGDSGLVKTTILDINGETMTADSAGLWPSNAAKISFVFADGYVSGNVSIGDMQAAAENGVYTFDLSAQPLSADTEYTVTVNGEVYGSFKTGSGAFTVAVPVIGDDNKGLISVSNTAAEAKTMYIISAAFDAQDNLVDLIYTMETVQPDYSGDYTIGVPDITGASKLKVFVWNGFETLEPYCAPAEKALN